MKKKYKIAGLIVAMDSFERTEKQAIPYLCDTEQAEDITIQSDIQALKDKLPLLSDDLAEYLSTGMSFYSQLLNYDGFMLHSSAVVVDGKAYLFSAPSGTGKSTHTELWLKYFGNRAYILNDDKPALRIIDGKWYAFGTPWSGKYDMSVNTGVELKGIGILERAEQNEIEPYTGKYAIFDIFSQANRPGAYELREKLLTLIGRLIEDVPVWKLKCNMDMEAAEIAYKAMSAEQEKNQ